MPYAHNGQISQGPIEGGIEITSEQYAEAMQGMLNGLEVTIDGGFKVAPKPAPEEPEPAKPSKEERIELLQSMYDSDRAKLNQAWLSAMITGGPNEAARKAAIMEQMTALDVQLETDILAILMEE